MPTTAASWSSSWIHSCSGVYLTVMGLSSGGRAAVVTVGNEGHGTHLHGNDLAAHERVHAGARRGELRGNIAHPDGPVDRRTQQAAGDFTDAQPLRVLQLAVLA